jgi:single-strand DNA-binding protein
MKHVNRITLLGYLGKDPIRRETKKGTAVVNFPVGTTYKFRKEGQSELEPINEVTQWHNIVVWGRPAENCMEYLKKGRPVYLEGSFRTSKYKADDGTTKYSWEVHAEDVSFLPHRDGEAARAS